jgi:hypothetical protein
MAGPRFVDLDQLAKLGSCTTPILADGAVTTEKLASDAIDASVIADGSISAIKLDADVFGAGLIPNGTTNAIDINVDNVTLELAADVLRVKNLGITVAKLNIDNNLSFNQNEALEFRIENLVADPVAGNPGRLIWRTDTNQVRVDDGTSFTSIGSGGGGGHTIQDESSPLTQRTNLNFVGAGVTVTDDSGNDATVVTIPGSGSGTFAKDLFTVTVPANHVFTLTTTPTANSELVIWNGIHLKPGASNDYTISGTTVTLSASITLTVGDDILVAYAF